MAKRSLKFFVLTLTLTALTLPLFITITARADHRAPEELIKTAVYVNKGDASRPWEFPPGTRVTSVPAGIDCPTVCNAEFTRGQDIVLTYHYSGSERTLRTWSSACDEKGDEIVDSSGKAIDGNYYAGKTCTIKNPIPEDTHFYSGITAYVSLTWDYSRFSLIAQKKGTGGGRITGSGININCGSQCSTTAPLGTDYTLTAIPDEGSVFAGWDQSEKTSKALACSYYPNFLKHIDSLTDTTCIASMDGGLSFNTFYAQAIFTKKSSGTAATQTTTVQPNSSITNLTLSDTTINGHVIDAASDTIRQFEEDEAIVLKGKTLPNAIVKLFIFSEPRTAEVTADENGEWTYTITDLPSGDHHVEFEITDLSANQTSERGQLLAFTILTNNNDISEPASSSNTQGSNNGNTTSSSAKVLSLILLLVAVTALSAYFILTKRSPSLKSIKSTLQKTFGRAKRLNN